MVIQVFIYGASLCESHQSLKPFRLYRPLKYKDQPEEAWSLYLPMDEKLFKFIEVIFLGGALILVIYLGGFFGPVEAWADAPTSINPEWSTINQTNTAKFETEMATNKTREATFLTSVSNSLTPAATEQFTQVPPVTSVSKPPLLTPTPSIQTYQISAGDSCLAIAYKFNVTLESLIALNGLDNECRILAGGTLKIPIAVTASP